MTKTTGEHESPSPSRPGTPPPASTAGLGALLARMEPASAPRRHRPIRRGGRGHRARGPICALFWKMARGTRRRLPHIRPQPAPMLSICEAQFPASLEQIVADVALRSLGLSREVFALATLEELPEEVVMQTMPSIELLYNFQQHALLRRAISSTAGAGHMESTTSTTRTTSPLRPKLGSDMKDLS